MTLYAEKLNEVRKSVYSNTAQIDTVVGIRNYIDKNYDAHIDLNILSDVHCVSKYHMIRLFKKYYGQTPRQYLIDKRITKAKEQLKTGKSVTETCFAIGFESLGSFSTLFKLKTGKSPITFKKAIFNK